MNSNKKKLPLSFIIVGIISIFFIFIVISITTFYYVNLKKYSETTTGIITGFSTGYKGKKYFEYEFYVGLDKYKGSALYYPESEFKIIGDSCEIIYDYTNPSNNKRLINKRTKPDIEKLKELRERTVQ